MIFLVPIVEGHGEVEAVPVLLHRIFREQNYNGQLIVNPPIRVKSGSFLNDEGYRRKMVSLACAKAAQRDGFVLVLLDCEDECPAQLGPILLRQVQAIRLDVSVLIALCYREYETWFVTAARSLRGRRGLPIDLDPPLNPDSVRGAKEWLKDRMNAAYDPITHQIEFSRYMDLQEARRNSSFNRLFNKLSALRA